MLFLSPTTSSPTATESSNTSNNHESIVSKSLAARFVINVKEGLPSGEVEWNLVPICNSIPSQAANRALGTMDIEALKNQSNDNMSCESILIKGQRVDERVTTSATMSSAKQTANDKGVNELVSTLARIMLQKLVVGMDVTGRVELISPCHHDVREQSAVGTYQVSDLLSSSGHPFLFSDLLSISDNDIATIEMSDMVDSEGNPLGYVPRILVHKFNLLHRGIGMVISRDEHITRSTVEFPDVYTHRRTDTKRIFPSLYDMFVGGISTAGESSRLTAAREVYEELGLKLALKEEVSTSTSARIGEMKTLSDELFKCIVCTSYNRCVVTLFTYKCDMNEETIKWQEEEVAWGDFVPYADIEKAAQMSIGRLKRSNEWPGMGMLEERNYEKYLTDDGEYELSSNEGNEDWREWDFVPDGLLVWEAWRRWMDQK
jgi:8-oxo-dGTP pyrophosphatase MutT (NUDIX family)